MVNPDLDLTKVKNKHVVLYQANVYSANRGDPSFSNLGLTVLKRSAIIIFGVYTANTKKLYITFVQCWTSIFDFGPTVYNLFVFTG